MRRTLALLCLALLLAVPAPRAALAGALSLGPPVGRLEGTLIEPGDTLLDAAWRHRVGFEAIARLNPDVDPWIPPPGTAVWLPTRYLLPDSEPEGLVLNIPEMRLYDFTGEDGPRVYAAAVGDAEDPTPTGRFRIGAKRRYPAWYVPRSIREKRPELPAVVPPGPGNPLGSRWMTIGTTSYGIHGTNVVWSIGRTATHGCVRLYEDEVQELFERIVPGTPIHLVYQLFKWGSDGTTLFLEAHPDLYEREPDLLGAALQVPRALGLLGAIDLGRVWKIVEEAHGIPEPVGRVPAHLVASDPIS
jgi:L,D-transpeptidase ErfK/SrfK